jgi:hypothetical protein
MFIFHFTVTTVLLPPTDLLFSIAKEKEMYANANIVVCDKHLS